LGSVLAVISIFIVFGTIRLSIYSLNKEIKIMKLVGASNYFMHGSFLVQGFILGLIASLSSFLILMGLVLMMHQGYNPLGIDLETHIIDNLSYILTLQFVTGIGLSVASSFVAVRKYLEV
jgi:cell division transport system permease protein